jgi:hypothetical protein
MTEVRGGRLGEVYHDPSINNIFITLLGIRTDGRSVCIFTRWGGALYRYSANCHLLVCATGRTQFGRLLDPL